MGVAICPAYDAVYERLIGDAEPLDVGSGFAMVQIKRTTALSLTCA